MTITTDKYIGGSRAIVTIDGKNYGECYYDGFNKQWVSPGDGRVNPNSDYYDSTVEVVFAPDPVLEEPKTQWSVVGLKNGSTKYVRVDYVEGYPWQRINGGGGSFSWDFLVKYYGPLEILFEAP